MSAGEWWIGLILSAATLLLGFFMRRTFASFDTLFKMFGGRLDRHDEQIDLMKSDSVTKEDWLRELHIARKRQEQMLADLGELKGRNGVATEIGMAIRAMTERIVNHER